MEYERALFRVHDRTLESLKMNEPCFPGRCGNSVTPRSVCAAIEVLLLSFAALCLLLLGVAHNSFVGEHAPPCVFEELRYLQKRENLAWDLANPNPTNLTKPKIPLFDKNSILALHITAHGDSTSEYLHKIEASDGNNMKGNESSWSGEFVPHYRFAPNPALLGLSSRFVKAHDVSVVNLTVARSCFTQGDSNRAAVVGLLGYDTIVINQLLTLDLPTGGLFENSRTGEEWYWRSTFAEHFGRQKKSMPFGEAIAYKVGIVGQTAMSFFFTATITALIVRMLISSGVVIMFPLFYCVRRVGVNLDLDILTMSYPWLGRPVARLEAQNKPTAPLIAAHCIRVVVLYSMYEACQLAWSLWLYDKPLPNGLQLEVYALVMVWEYFSMIYLRSAAGIYYLPKFTLLYFAFFHIYFYGCPYGFFGVALLIVYTLVAHGLVATVLRFELPASERLDVTWENTRAYFTELPWPSWNASLPPSWTLFMPLNSRQVSLYDDNTIGSGGVGGEGVETDGERVPEADERVTSEGETETSQRTVRRAESLQGEGDIEMEGLEMGSSRINRDESDDEIVGIESEGDDEEEMALGRRSRRRQNR